MKGAEKGRSRVLVFFFHLLRHKFDGKGCGWANCRRSSASICVKTGGQVSPLSPSSPRPVPTSFIKIWVHGKLIKQSEGPNLTTLSAPGRVRPGWEFSSVPKTEGSRWTEVPRRYIEGQSWRFRFGNCKSNCMFLLFPVKIHLFL